MSATRSPLHRARAMARTRRTLALVPALAIALAACGDDGGDTELGGSDCRAVEGGEVTIVAKDIEWDTDCLEGPAGEAFTIVVDNQDDGIAHNLNIEDTDFSTELETGPVTQELEVTLEEGEYDFVCDIHPNMVGTLRAIPAS